MIFLELFVIFLLVIQMIRKAMQDLINQWYVGIAAQKGGILTDIRKVNEMLDFKLTNTNQH